MGPVTALGTLARRGPWGGPGRLPVPTLSSQVAPPRGRRGCCRGSRACAPSLGETHCPEATRQGMRGRLRWRSGQYRINTRGRPVPASQGRSRFQEEGEGRSRKASLENGTESWFIEATGDLSETQFPVLAAERRACRCGASV